MSWDDEDRRTLGPLLGVAARERREAATGKTARMWPALWQHDPESGVIENVGGHYWIDLGRCRTSAEILDWIVQISQKQGVSNACIGDLVRELNRVLDLQSGFCGMGEERGPRNSAEIAERLQHEPAWWRGSTG